MKDVKVNIDVKVILAFLQRYNFVISIVLIVSMLSIAILLLSGVVNKASGLDSTPTGSSISSFDEETIERVKQLKTSEDPGSPIDLSRGRINPFSE